MNKDIKLLTQKCKDYYAHLEGTSVYIEKNTPKSSRKKPRYFTMKYGFLLFSLIVFFSCDIDVFTDGNDENEYDAMDRLITFQQFNDGGDNANLFQFPVTHTVRISNSNRIYYDDGYEANFSHTIEQNGQKTTITASIRISDLFRTPYLTLPYVAHIRNRKQTDSLSIQLANSGSLDVQVLLRDFNLHYDKQSNQWIVAFGSIKKYF